VLRIIGFKYLGGHRFIGIFVATLRQHKQYSMTTEILKALFTRDLEKLKAEIKQYHHESTLWQIDKNITNSAGNLCLHLIGNLNAFIGANLGQTGYIRQRDLEFSLKDVSRSELLAKLDATVIMVNEVLDKLPSAELEKEYPVLVFEKPLSTAQFLAHLTTHLAYHLGQINYHRRLLDTDGTGLQQVRGSL
jgi:uncharacterized damage-inducible protein DinB